MSVFFLLYVAFTDDVNLLGIFAHLSTNAYALSVPEVLGIPPNIVPLLQNIWFTALEATLLVNLFWSYKVGVASNNLFQQDSRNTFVGISGDSGVGKSTLAKALENIIGEKNVVYLNGDDLHKWERGDDKWKEVTHLHPGANYMQTDLEHAVRK